jgi:hypothetical protein
MISKKDKERMEMRQKSQLDAYSTGMSQEDDLDYATIQNLNSQSSQLSQADSERRRMIQLKEEQFDNYIKDFMGSQPEAAKPKKQQQDIGQDGEPIETEDVAYDKLLGEAAMANADNEEDRDDDMDDEEEGVSPSPLGGGIGKVGLKQQEEDP